MLLPFRGHSCRLGGGGGVKDQVGGPEGQGFIEAQDGELAPVSASRQVPRGLPITSSLLTL